MSPRAQDEAPPRIAALRWYRGLPIAFDTYVGTDGIPDFRRNHNHLREKAIVDRLCGVCGQPHEPWIVFIGDQDTCRSRYFEEPGMHEECARFAARFCPGLSSQHYRPRNEDVRHDPRMAPWVDHDFEGRPERLAFYFVHKYKVVSDIVNGVKRVRSHPTPARRLEWF